MCRFENKSRERIQDVIDFETRLLVFIYFDNIEVVG